MMGRNDRGRARGCAGRALAIAAMLAPPLMTGLIASSGAVLAQSEVQKSFSIPAGPLSQALASFGRQSGLQISYPSELTSSKQSPGFIGSATSQQALTRLLSGSGLSFAFANATTIAISGPGSNNNATSTVKGAIALDTIDVSGGGIPAADQPYYTPGATAHISQETIERFRGSSPADMFRSTPGVMSGEARNGAGAIDVNIRGMQGMGRVAVSVDGAENSLQVYQGYQGISNRTFVDPDLLAGIDITKGSEVSSSGIAGTVAMRTLDASDIVESGKTFGLRIKGGFGGNTSTPTAGAKAGYGIQNVLEGYPTVTSSNSGLDRPDFLEATQGSGSVVGAMKTENVDLLAAYAYRKQGNYHAGTNGPSAKPVSTGPRPFCYPNGSCPFNYYDYVVNAGLANYRAGEEVLNTQLETESVLAKGTFRFGDGHSVQLGYSGFRSEAGDLLASALASDMSRPTQQKQTAGTELDTGTMRYRWKPAGNALIDLKADLWTTNLELRNPARNAYGTKPGSLGLPADFRTGSDTRMWGAGITNTSSLPISSGLVDLTYGLSYRNEDTRPSAYTDIIEGWLNLRDAERDEAAFFTKAAYKPVDWLTINGGMRYAHFWSHDRRTKANSPDQLNSKPERDEGGFSPFVGVTVEPSKGTQFYVNYSNAVRFPSLFESVSAFTIIPNPDLGPERSSNWEIGANFRKGGLLTGNDTGMLKLSYFNWDVQDYIARAYRAFPGNGYTWYGMQVYNIDRAKFSGLELSARYEYSGFAAELGANYYLDVVFCQSAGACESKSMYGDYATNQVPPEYSVNLTLSQKLLNDKLTLGGRVSYTGPRAIGHGQVTSQGLSQFITQVQWEPYTLVDVFAEYKINDNLTGALRVENLTDRYYVDPLSLVQIPGPGRTIYGSLTAKF